jgi:hypothetical protein
MFSLKYSEDENDPSRIIKDFIGNPINEFSDMFDRFTSFYSIKNLLTDDEFHKRPLKPKTDRVCRFCGATFSTKGIFKSDAHLLSKAIGNKNLFSDFECHQCNTFFNRFENDLANFIGASRAFTIDNAKSGKLKFRSPDQTFIIQKDNETPAGVPKLQIESHGEENDHFTLDQANKQITFHTTRPSYNPYNVYKALLKMSLSVLPEQYVVDYEKAFKLLRSIKKNEIKDNPFFRLNLFMHSGPAFPSPMVIIFEKINLDEPLPSHMACIMFMNYSYQLALPLNAKDKWMYDGITKINFPSMPPFIDKAFANEFGIPKGQRLDFSLDKLKKKERHDIVGTFEEYIDVKYD